MVNQVQTRRSRLANNLCLNDLKAMDPFEIIAHSFVSKEALSMVQNLRLPIKSVKILMWEDPRIELEFGNRCIVLELQMRKNNKQIISLNALPVKVKIWKNKTMGELNYDDPRNPAVIMSNYGMTLGEWIQHLCSISDNEIPCDAEFFIEDIRFDIQSFRNNLPKFRRISVVCSENETNETDTIYAENLVRAFVSDVQDIVLFFVPPHFPLQYVAMANLKFLRIYSGSNLNYDCLFTLNVESCSIHSDQMPLRDLNRFFKLWIKGSNPRLKQLFISCDNVVAIAPDWNVLLKGLRAEDAETEGIKKYIIKNCRGISGQIEVEHLGIFASVIFFVSN
ncbi:unnamed protein product [Caenorhabditis nigoni]